MEMLQEVKTYFVCEPSIIINIHAVSFYDACKHIMIEMPAEQWQFIQE